MENGLNRTEYLVNLYFQSDDDSEDQNYAVGELGDIFSQVAGN